MSIFDDRYEYLTRKQANIIYAAIKRGELEADSSFTNDMYAAVEDRRNETYAMMRTCQLIISLIFDDQLELAQNVIDGAWYEQQSSIVDYRDPTEDELRWCFTEEDEQELIEEGVPVYGNPEWIEVDNPYA